MTAVGIHRQKLTIAINTDVAPETQLSMGHVVMPAGGTAKFHVHHNSDVIILVVEGHAATVFGGGIPPAIQRPGDYLLIPRGVPHTAVNLSMEHRVVAVECRADPTFTDMDLMPELEAIVPAIATQLRAEYGGQHPSGHFTDAV